MKRFITSFLATITFSFVMLSPTTVYGADVFKGVCDGNGQNSTVCKEVKSQESGNDNPLFGPDGVITFIINLMSAIAGIAAVIMIILGGFKMVTSGNNPQDISKAREVIIYAVVGLIIAVSAQLIVRVFLNKIGAS